MTKLTLREKIQAALNGGGKFGRITEMMVFGVTIVAATLFATQTLPDLQPQTQRALDGVELFLSVLFLCEYIARVYAAPRRLAYIFSFWGLVDLAATAPALALFGVDSAAVRTLRLLRLSGVIKVMRIGDARDRLLAAMKGVAKELLVFFCFALVTLYLSAFGIYFFEYRAQPDVYASIPHSMWWAIVTLTTVGYGDVYPITVGGKIFTGFVLLVGLSIVAIPTALFSSALLEAREETPDAEQPNADGPNNGKSKTG